MATLNYHAGSAAPLGIRPLQADGTPPDLATAVMQLRIPLGGACLALDGAQNGGRWDVDLSGVEFQSRLYPASVWIDWGDGWVFTGTVYLNVSRGC